MSQLFGKQLSQPINLSGSFTGSFLGTLNGTASYAISSSYSVNSTFAVSSSKAISSSYALNSSFATSASYATTSSYALNIPTINTGSFIITASATLNEITFTKADTSTFNITVDTGSVDLSGYITTASFNNFTSSYNTGSFSGSFVGDGSGLTNIPSQSFDTGSFATTGSNTFYGLQVISASSVDLSALDIHVKDEALWAFRIYNDTYSSSSIGLASWIDNSGISFLGTETDKPLYLYNNASYYSPTLIISSSGVTVGAGGITGSLFGTASYAESSSYSETASYALNALLPGGSDTSVQYNVGGTSFGGGADFTYDGNSNLLTLTGQFSQGSGTQAIGNHSHAEGANTQAVGLASHAEGTNTSTGFYGYYSNDAGSSTSGLIILDSAYGDVANQFPNSAYIILDDSQYNNIYGIVILQVTSNSFNIFTGCTEITLIDNTISTDEAHIFIIGNPLPTNYDANYYLLGDYSHVEGLSTISIGGGQHVQGRYNKLSTEESVFIIGNGTYEDTRSNLIYASGSQFQISGSLLVSGAIESGGSGHIITYDTTSGLFTYTASSAIGGGGSSTPTGSLLTTASVTSNTITFTKGDGSTFPITVNTGSGGGGPVFPFTGSAIITGSLIITGSTISTLGFTGSLLGTASFATSASNAVTASYINTLRATGSNTQIQYNNNGVLGSTSNFYYSGSNLIVLNSGKIVQGDGFYRGIIGPTGQRSANERGVYSEYETEGNISQFPIVSHDGTNGIYYFANYQVNYNSNIPALIVTGSLRITNPTQGGGSGHILTYNTTSGEVFFTASSAIGGDGGNVSNLKSGSFGVTIDGNGGVITVGQKGYITIPYNGTITSWQIMADQAGACNIDVKKSTFATFPTQLSITGSAPITMSAALKASSSILTGWTTSSTAGDVYGFTLNSATSITRLNLIINTIKS